MISTTYRDVMLSEHQVKSSDQLNAVSLQQYKLRTNCANPAG